MTKAAAPETAIRRAREESNRRIAAHDADGATALMDETVLVIPSGGGLLSGRAAVRAALEASFADPDFVTYRRAADRIAIDPDGSATETGRWKGLWKAEAGRHALSGHYSARWRKQDGRWLILSETFRPQEGAD